MSRLAFREGQEEIKNRALAQFRLGLCDVKIPGRKKPGRSRTTPRLNDLSGQPYGSAPINFGQIFSSCRRKNCWPTLPVTPEWPQDGAV